MPIFLLKSLLSLIIILLALFAMFTMFEVFGRAEKKYNIEKLKKLHRLNSRIYLLLFLIIAYFCVEYLLKTKAELSARAAFHSIFAIAIVILLLLKISFVRIYRQFYGHVKLLGILIALFTFGMVATSGGYYLLITKFGTDVPIKKAAPQEKEIQKESRIMVRTDHESIRKGKELYEAKCSFCHDASSIDTIVGPGHKGILKNPYLPVSKRPATPGNVAEQIRNPYRDMPSFSYLTEDEVLNIIAFINTL